jgi:hypothetical protein
MTTAIDASTALAAARQSPDWPFASPEDEDVVLPSLATTLAPNEGLAAAIARIIDAELIAFRVLDAELVKYSVDQPRVPAGTAAGGQFAGDGSAATTEGTGRAASAPILAGSPPDPQSVIDEFSEAFARNHTPMGGVIDVAKHQAAADAEAATFTATLRASPLVHGTSAEAAAAMWRSGGLDSSANSADRIASLTEQLRDAMGHDNQPELDAAIAAAQKAGDTTAIDDWIEAQSASGVLTDEEMQQALGYTRAIQGKTYPGDQALGLDRFVFFQHGNVRFDYGTTFVVVDNRALNQPGAFGTPGDIVNYERSVNQESDWTHGYSDAAIQKYQQQMLRGEDYYRAAGYARAGGAHLEVKLPDHVDKKDILGFVVSTGEEHETLVKAGVPESKLMYLPSDASDYSGRFAARTQYLQQHGSWPDMAPDSEPGYHSTVDPEPKKK